MYDGKSAFIRRGFANEEFYILEILKSKIPPGRNENMNIVINQALIDFIPAQVSNSNKTYKASLCKNTPAI